MLYRWRKPTCWTSGLYTKQAASHAPFVGQLFSAGLFPFFLGGEGERRALHGPGASAGDRGRTETPLAKLSACATCHYARKIGGRRGVRGALRGRGCTAHYAGGAMGTSRPTAITHERGARRVTRAARWGHRALPPLHTAISHAGGGDAIMRAGCTPFFVCALPVGARAGACEDNCRHGAGRDYSVSVTSPTSCLSFGFSSRSVSTCIFSVAVAQSV